MELNKNEAMKMYTVINVATGKSKAVAADAEAKALKAQFLSADDMQASIEAATGKSFTSKMLEYLAHIWKPTNRKTLTDSEKSAKELEKVTETVNKVAKTNINLLIEVLLANGYMVEKI